jgi:hypothetical protein
MLTVQVKYSKFSGYLRTLSSPLSFDFVRNRFRGTRESGTSSRRSILVPKYPRKHTRDYTINVISGLALLSGGVGYARGPSHVNMKRAGASKRWKIVSPRYSDEHHAIKTV